MIYLPKNNFQRQVKFGGTPGIIRHTSMGLNPACKPESLVPECMDFTLWLWYFHYILIDLIGITHCIWTINSTINIQYMPPSFKWISKVLTLSSSELHIVCFSSRTSRGPCFVRVKSWPRRKNAFRFIHGGMERWNIRF